MKEITYQGNGGLTEIAVMDTEFLTYLWVMISHEVQGPEMLRGGGGSILGSVPTAPHSLLEFLVGQSLTHVVLQQKIDSNIVGTEATGLSGPNPNSKLSCLFWAKIPD